MNDKSLTWLDRIIDDATNHGVDSIASDLRTARGFLESAREVLDLGLANPEKAPYHETLRRLRHALVKALAFEPFAAPPASSTSSDLRRVLTESIAYACEELKRSPSVPEVRVAVAITANVERVRPEPVEPDVEAFRAWRDGALHLAIPGHDRVTESALPLAEIVARFHADQAARDGVTWSNLDHTDIASLLTELFHVRLGLENGGRMIYGLRWRTP